MRSHKELLTRPLRAKIESVDVVCPRASTAIHNDKYFMNEVQKKVADFDSLYRALQICKHNVMWKDSVAGYVKNGLANCYKLSEQLNNGTYRIDKYTRFTIYEPKKRDIVSTRIKDRVFQRSLCDNYLYSEITKHFIYDNCACQIGKGTDFALNRLKAHLQQYYRRYGISGYVLKCDISNYFGSTRHDVAKAAVRKRVRDDWAYNHTADIIDSFNQGENPAVGMGLGSQITQLVELAVLDDLDHFIKERLGIRHYIRYMDDFILIHPDKGYLKYCYTEIQKQLALIGLKLSEKKTQLFPVSQTIKFLGFGFRLTTTGKVLMILSQDNISDERRKLKRLKALVDTGRMLKSQVDDSFNSWKAHAMRGNAYTVIQEMNKFYNNLWEAQNVSVQKC